jgi:hypothetical protein
MNLKNTKKSLDLLVKFQPKQEHHNLNKTYRSAQALIEWTSLLSTRKKHVLLIKFYVRGAPKFLKDSST